jgi:hypothetical protein
VDLQATPRTTPEWDAFISGVKLGVVFQNSAMCAEVRLQAARSYSLISPPRTDRRLIRCRSRRGAE